MNWHECNSVEELKKIGKLSDLRLIIKSELKEGTKISFRSWEDLLEIIKNIRNVFHSKSKFSHGEKTEETICIEVDYDGFISEAAKYIFCLTKLDGKNRQSNLGVTTLHYSNKDVAKKWKQKIIQKIHPDHCSHPSARKAYDVLNMMYKEMVR
jgi:hypothetical protein